MGLYKMDLEVLIVRQRSMKEVYTSDGSLDDINNAPCLLLQMDYVVEAQQIARYLCHNAQTSDPDAATIYDTVATECNSPNRDEMKWRGQISKGIRIRHELTKLLLEIRVLL